MQIAPQLKQNTKPNRTWVNKALGAAEIILAFTPFSILLLTGCSVQHPNDRAEPEEIPKVEPPQRPSVTPRPSGTPRPEVTPEPTPSSAGSYADFLDVLGFRESSDKYNARSPSGTYLGRYQMGPPALQDAGFMTSNGNWTDYARKFGVTCGQSFLNSPSAQEAAVRAYHQGRWRSIVNWGHDKHIGTTFSGNLAGSTEIISVEITASGLLAAAHLVGTGQRGLAGMFETGIIPVDGNGTPATEYLNFKGFDLTDLLEWSKN
jgi:hypothetical protein